MPDVLADIIRHKRAENRRLPKVDRRDPCPSDRDFAGALRGWSRQIIAELKPRSPSCGELCSDYKPDEIARRYEEAGAVALSVLTDEKFFGGQPTHLTQARRASTLPVLRKDFIIEENQVLESRLIGADACLLIVAALEQDLLCALKARIEELGMVALVEVHDERELEIALATNPTLIGVNNRNLHDLTIDPGVIHRLCPLVPDGVLLVSESGVTTPQDVRELPQRVNGVLIGTALMRSSDTSGFIRQATEGREIAK
jgi:indole-3-glycerol phosphate synthase